VFVSANSIIATYQRARARIRLRLRLTHCLSPGMRVDTAYPRKKDCWNGSIHLGVVTVVWNFFSGAEGRNADRLIQLPRRRAGQEKQSTENPKN